MKIIVRIIFWIFGWKIDQKSPEGIKKAVLVVGPHTSNWDFVIGRMAFVLYGIKPKILIKKELFFPPFGWILRALGGIPVDRIKKNNITEQAVELFNSHDEIFMIFTPEGTRSYNPNWKKGFYYIAMKAHVPIYMCYIDYKTKTGGFHKLFTPTGDAEKDIAYIKKELSQFQGRFPEQGIR